MKLITIFLAFFLYLNSQAQIDEGFKRGNATEISKYLANMVVLDILGETSEASSLEAYNALATFMQKNPTENYMVIHQGSTSSGVQYKMAELKSTDKTYLINYLLRNEAGLDKIIELTISEK